jgi:hypothetical protein
VLIKHLLNSQSDFKSGIEWQARGMAFFLINKRSSVGLIMFVKQNQILTLDTARDN